MHFLAVVEKINKIKGQNYKRDQCRKIRDLKGKLSGLITP